MKIILNILLLSAVVLCELPPPYSQRGFRPSPQFLSQLFSLHSPQTEYGPPKLQSNYPQTSYGPPKLQVSSPQTQYGPPKPQLNSPHTKYGPPKLQSPFPQPQYGSPKSQSNILDLTLPSKLTIEQVIRLTEQIQSSQERIVYKPQSIQLSTPQNSYLPAPPKQPHNVYGPPDELELSQSQLRPPPASNFGASQPQNSYRPPQAPQHTYRPLRPQNQYGPPSQPLNIGTDNSGNSPQTTYGVPNVPGNQVSFQVPPSTNYGVPDLRSVETLGELRNKPQSDQDILRHNLLNDLTKQHLPYREPTGFRPQNTAEQTASTGTQQYVPPQSGISSPNPPPQNFGSGSGGAQNQGFIQGGSTGGSQNISNLNQQYLPANSGNGNQRPQNGLGGSRPENVPQTGINNNIPQAAANPGISQGGSPFGTASTGQNYLPPQTTPRPVSATRPSTISPRTVETTQISTDGTTNYDYDYDVQQPTEAPTNQEGSGSDPNVSISNAVAGGGGFFYLQQPDGRLQRVVLQKTQEPNSKPEEYIANYYFQNIQPLAAVTYTPLISLGSWK